MFWVPCDVSYTGVFPGISHSYAGHVYGSDKPGQWQRIFFLSIEVFQSLLYGGHVGIFWPQHTQPRQALCSGYQGQSWRRHVRMWVWGTKSAFSSFLLLGV